MTRAYEDQHVFRGEVELINGEQREYLWNTYGIPMVVTSISDHNLGYNPVFLPLRRLFNKPQKLLELHPTWWKLPAVPSSRFRAFSAMARTVAAHDEASSLWTSLGKC